MSRLRRQLQLPHAITDRDTAHAAARVLEFPKLLAAEAALGLPKRWRILLRRRLRLDTLQTPPSAASAGEEIFNIASRKRTGSDTGDERCS